MSRSVDFPDEDRVDYLDVDRPIPGQSYCCLSFVSPEKVILQKQMFYLQEFLKENATKYGLDQSGLSEVFDDWIYTKKKQLNEKYDTNNDFKTSVRGVKIRGTYNTLQEAQIRAKVLQKLDDSFHVFVGQVGFWLPWDPEADNVEGQEYADEELNNLMKKYQENKINRDIHYQQMKKERQEKHLKEKLERKAKAEAERKANEAALKEQEAMVVEVTDVDSGSGDGSSSGVGDVDVAATTTQVDSPSQSVPSSDIPLTPQQMSSTFSQEDPWMQRKNLEKEQAGTQEINTI